MIKTLMRGLVEKDMQAVINTYDLKPYYYPTLFPLKETYTLTWKALEAQVGLKIAADLVARGATIDKKDPRCDCTFAGGHPENCRKAYQERRRTYGLRSNVSHDFAEPRPSRIG
ncbi:hypothetical protein [Phocaeicola vulgatus]|uniref:hypothetical protein n=1 Tax=Phocaeicola vulgatus TaxID=821 RepID=UPI002165A176|nr:hypothetical protein [Phocaeicola vulgatus]MCS2996367.1 hypothetical protein [Phocaeicola vulgatus]